MSLFFLCLSGFLVFLLPTSAYLVVFASACYLSLSLSLSVSFSHMPLLSPPLSLLLPSSTPNFPCHFVHLLPQTPCPLHLGLNSSPGNGLDRITSVDVYPSSTLPALQDAAISIPSHSQLFRPFSFVRVTLMSDQSKSGRRRTRTVKRTLTPEWSEALPTFRVRS